MFCPNCGTKNDDTATPCTKCGFKLSGASAPKFRGTMMLNTEQSLQEMVEEHRRKLAEAGSGPDQASGPGAVSPGPVESVPSAPPPGPPKAGVQPPRAGLPKRRMGTMLGVAPQMGGVKPPDTSTSTPTPVPASPTGPDAAVTGEVPSLLDPLGGTVAFAAVPPASASPSSDDPGEGSPSPADPLAPGRTQGFAAIPTPGAPAPAVASLTAGRTEAFQAPHAAPPNPLAAGRTEAFAASPEPLPPAAARGRTELFEAAAPALAAPTTMEPTPAPADAPDSVRPAGVPPQRLRPLDVFLVVITCGLYGLVLWARQQRRAG